MNVPMTQQIRFLDNKWTTPEQTKGQQYCFTTVAGLVKFEVFISFNIPAGIYTQFFLYVSVCMS